MNHSKTLASLFFIAGCTAAGGAAADRPDQGRREVNSCAACPGMDAKETGPLRASLNKPPGDLTLLTQRNGGVFPTQHVQQVIDGPYNAEAYVAARVLLLTDYLNRIQAK